MIVMLAAELWQCWQMETTTAGAAASRAIDGVRSRIYRTACRFY
jgi:hypothetical protein